MSLPFPLLVGLRYSFSRRRNRFTLLIATISMLGMVLGVASLITVLSVMNGFSAELRDRILSLVPHGYVLADSGELSEWRKLSEQLLDHPAVDAVAPYIEEKIIVGSRYNLRGARITAVDPELEKGVSRLHRSILRGDYRDLQAAGYSAILGVSLARALRVQVGDSVEVTLPRLNYSPLGVFPRSKRLTVVGIFEVGAELDNYQLYVSLATGQKLMGLGTQVEGLQVKTGDLFAAPMVMDQLKQTLEAGYHTRDWSQTQGSLFQAVKMEKLMVSLLLLSVVAVAAFNIISTLAMAVTEKRAEIAVLRTLGAGRGTVMGIFVFYGVVVGTVGISLGVIAGVVLSLNIAQLVSAAESFLGMQIFDPSVYFISTLPAELRWPDVISVSMAALVLSLLATLYPARRAAQIAPAEVLNHE